MRFMIALFLFLLALPVFAANFVFEDAFMRETPMKISAAYVTIRNETGQDDVLQSASAPWAKKIELHDVKIDNNGVLQMSAMKEGLQIKKDSTESLRPGGRHFMIYDLIDKLKAGDVKKMVLHFERAGDVMVPFTVKPITYRGAAAKANDPHAGHH